MIHRAKPGPKPKGKVKIKWSADFAYAIGLLVSDGNLSPDGRHIVFTSKDNELIDLFKKSLKIDVSVGRKAGSWQGEKIYHVAQFSDVLFYQFLLSIGLMPNKSKVIGPIGVPCIYFLDFLRGSFDGDGCTHSYIDPRWRSSFMFYTIFVSASSNHIDWLRSEIEKHVSVRGHITGSGKKGTVFQLKYAKADSLKVWRKLYYKNNIPCLTRKRLKINAVLRIIGERQV